MRCFTFAVTFYGTSSCLLSPLIFPRFISVKNFHSFAEGSTVLVDKQCALCYDFADDARKCRPEAR
jgi:hypothetical protein